jgi:hypothetical protein
MFTRHLSAVPAGANINENAPPEHTRTRLFPVQC